MSIIANKPDIHWVKRGLEEPPTTVGDWNWYRYSECAWAS
jgi:hypothetical protein